MHLALADGFLSSDRTRIIWMSPILQCRREIHPAAAYRRTMKFPRKPAIIVFEMAGLLFSAGGNRLTNDGYGAERACTATVAGMAVGDFG
jgi:hypothetical protein